MTQQRPQTEPDTKNPPIVTLAAIEAARRTIAGHVLRTPLLPAPPLSALTGAEVYVKYENLQVTNSFKERGACVKLAALTAEERSRGVIAMSAGNHAQAVAYHARRLAIPATIVMPVMTPFVKVKATEALGATVVLCGETLTEAQARAEAIADERNLVWVHPFDDPHIIAGQGTIALEMLEEAPDIETMVIPIGGGGLIAGNAVAARAVKPSIEIVGVECALYPSMWNAIHRGARPCGGATLAEGIAVSKAGALTLPVVRQLVRDIILVDEPQIERAVNAFLTLQKAMAEGARKRARSTDALATTGIAGPSGGSEEKPVGTVYVALAGESDTKIKKLFFPSDRETFKQLTAQVGFEMLRRKLI